MLREATKTFDGTSLAVQLAEARATVQMLEFNVRRLESELDGSDASSSTDQPQQEQSCGIGSDATCQVALQAAEAESLSRKLNVLKADSARADASRQELDVTINRQMNETANSNSNLEISQVMDASVNFDSDSSVPLETEDEHTGNFSIAQQQRQRWRQQQQQGRTDPFGEGSELVGSKDLEVLLTGGQA